MLPGSSVCSVQLQETSRYDLDRVQQSDKMPGCQGRQKSNSEHERRSDSSASEEPYHRADKECFGVLVFSAI